MENLEKKTSPTFFSEMLRVEVEIKCKINQFKTTLIFDVCDDLFSNRVNKPISQWLCSKQMAINKSLVSILLTFFM